MILYNLNHKLLKAREGTHRAGSELNHVTKLSNTFFVSPSRFGWVGQLIDKYLKI